VTGAARFAANPAFESLQSRLQAGDPRLAAHGLWGSCAAFTLSQLLKTSQRPILAVSGHAEQADILRDDLESLLGRTDFLPAAEAQIASGDEDLESTQARAALCAHLHGSGATAPIVAPIQALLQAVPTSDALTDNTLALAVENEYDMRRIAEWLVARGFERLDQVEQPGDFAIRGGILDIFDSPDRDPLRLEFFGDELESIRRFDVATQRSTHTVRDAQITRVSASSGADPHKTCCFLNYLPAGTLMVLIEPMEIAEVARTMLERMDQPVGYFTFEALMKNAEPFQQLHLSRFPSASVKDVDTVVLPTGPAPTFDVKPGDAALQLLSLAQTQPVCVYCENAGERDRLHELLTEAAEQRETVVPEQLDIELGLIHEGFQWGKPTADSAEAHGDTCLFLTHHEIFHRDVRNRRLRPVTAGRPIDSFLDLKEGDYVVHVVHGVAKFTGLRTLTKRGTRHAEEFLSLRFAEGAGLHVPVTQIDLVQKYIGPRAARPPLSKLGGTRWQKTKDKVEEALTDLASELLRIQAERASSPGVAYPRDTHWQQEFESAFPYNPTVDQLAAMGAIKGDQQAERPMDRLVCGDVGFGKTELAIRAAFKVVEFGRQVAVLVPTTVLAEQHFRTFRQRMAEYPFRIECLNRFRSTAEQKQIIAAARKGQVDILIGTHRILSKDVSFADLGLAIIDEEQRFGVEHKERLKTLRTTVDVLTLTATPIPRTLHLSMIGLRDISSLATPPMDRRSIVTRVTSWSDELVREAIVRELNRDGQIFFVHNRVHSIHDIATKLATLVPDVRIVVGHGQMSGEELEDVMTRFVKHEADILVSTTIIEAGLDIPNANTMIIDHADRFGLADLHQLRGRVGRYKNRAYCYLLLDGSRPVTEGAARRLKAIEQCSELGAGFRIAMRDLEIRGAGNILGSEQSGEIAAVGYDLYCQMLERCVKRMRGDVVDERPSVHLELDVDATVPRGYITSDRQRMETYRRFAACRTVTDVEQLESDLRDAFGPVPDSVATLLSLAEIRVRASDFGITTIIRKEPDVVFHVTGELKRLEKLFETSGGRASMADPGILHWRLPDRYFHGDSLLPVLRNLLRNERRQVVKTEQAVKQAEKPSEAEDSTSRPLRKPTAPLRATPNARPADAPVRKKRRRRRRDD